jgi:predicted permease
MESFYNDLKHSLRVFRQSPSFTITAVAALAMGIGANTAIFTVIDTVVFQALPYPDSNRIVIVGRPGTGALSEPLFTYLTQNNPGFEDLSAYHAGASMNLTIGDKPQLVETISASREYFRLFGARAFLGRTFSAAEDSPAGARVLLLSYALWQRAGADPSILGKTLALGGAPYAVVGVLSHGFQPNPPADVWIPLQADPNSANQASVLTVSGRLSPGSTLTQANAWITTLLKRYAKTHSGQFRPDPQTRCIFMQQQITGDVRPALIILAGAVGLVLLIACANVANLLLARVTARRKEIAIRAALGARRGRIVRQLLTESLLLSLAGGAVGLVLGSFAVRALLAFAPSDLPRLREIAAIPALDPRVAGFTFLIAALSGVLFTMVPAFHLARTEISAALNESGGRTGSGPTRNRTYGALVAGEVATAVVLLCGALLLIRSFASMHSVTLGFNPHNLLTMEISLAGPGYAKSSAVDSLARQFVERAERISGVETAALASALPLWGRMDMIFDIPGRAPSESHQFSGDVQWRFVSAHYFDVLQIPLIAGRQLRDREPGHTVVISQTMARRFWPGANPVGQAIFIGPGLGPAYQAGITEIAGVVGDVRERLNVDPQPVMYQTPSQIPDADMALLNSSQPGAILIRTNRGVAPMSVSQAVQQALLAGDRVAAAKTRTMEEAGFDSTAQQNFNLLLLGLFAAIALLLAAVGIFGVMAYSVERRTHELGVRAALGANRRNILSFVLLQALRMALIGVGAGIAAAFGLTRLLSTQLFGVKSSDPITFAAASIILLAVAVAAAGIPALRATRIDPLTALRHE